VLKRLFGLNRGTEKTRETFFEKIREAFREARVIDDDLWEEVEMILLQADVGVATTEELLRRLRESAELGEAKNGDELYEILREELEALLAEDVADRPLLPSPTLNAVLVIGVNGVGKTTSIAKLGAYWRDQGHRVILAAADTPRRLTSSKSGASAPTCRSSPTSRTPTPARSSTTRWARPRRGAPTW
jgi:fused signal recognition particle receptor